MARCLVEFAACRDVQVIEVATTMISARPDLTLHLLPQVVSFISRHLAHMTRDRVLPTIKLLKALCGDRRRHHDPRTNSTLAVAMSKHAPSMLAAYVRGLANPQIRIPSESRRQLQTSIYQVCDLVIRAQHRGREGEGLGQPFGVGDSGEVEKEIWAEMWTSWSRQRYRGLG